MGWSWPLPLRVRGKEEQGRGREEGRVVWDRVCSSNPFFLSLQPQWLPRRTLSRESWLCPPLMLLVCFKAEGADKEAASRPTVLQGSQCPLSGQPLGWVTAHENGGFLRNWLLGRQGVVILQDGSPEFPHALGLPGLPWSCACLAQEAGSGCHRSRIEKAAPGTSYAATPHPPHTPMTASRVALLSFLP